MEILKKLTNTKTIFAIAGAVMIILNSIGVKFDSDTVNGIIKAACSILVLLGIMNNNGMDTTKWNDKQ